MTEKYAKDRFRDPESREVEHVIAAAIAASETFLDETRDADYKFPSWRATKVSPTGKPEEIEIDSNWDMRIDGHASVSYSRSGHLFKIDIDKDNDKSPAYTWTAQRSTGPVTSLRGSASFSEGKDALASVTLTDDSELSGVEFTDPTSGKRLGEFRMHRRVDSKDPKKSWVEGFDIDVDGDGTYDMTERRFERSTSRFKKSVR